MDTDYIEKQKAAMLDCAKWPQWPILPLKRIHNGKGECAVLFAYRQDDGEVLFTEGNMYDPEITEKIRGSKPRPVEDVIRAGWMVD